MIVITLWLILISVIIIKYVLYRRRMESYVKNLPSLKPILPILGNAHHFIGIDTARLFTGILEFIQLYGTPAVSWIGPVCNITLDKPEDVKAILMSPSCLDKPYMYRFLPSTRGILTAASGEYWKPIRKLLNPTFNLKILQSFVPIFNEKTNIMVKNLDKEAGNGTFDVSKYIFACTLDMVCATTMGYNVDVQMHKNHDFLKSIETICEIVGKRFIKFWSHPNFIYRFTDLYKAERRESDVIDKLTGHIRQVKKQEYFEKNKENINNAILEDSDESYKTPQVLIDQMFRLYYAGKFTEDIVKEQIETVIIAGNETSALTISYVILLLAMYPEVQEKLYGELKSNYNDDNDDYSTYEQIQKLTYLDWVLKEGLRLYPAAPFIVRCCTKDTKISTCTIPKDAIVMLSIFTMQRRKDIWGDDAEEFNPNRFDPDQNNGRDAFSFQPFSGGPRNCIGLVYAMISMKVILAAILRKYRFETDLKLNELILRFELTLKLSNKHLVRMERRN